MQKSLFGEIWAPAKQTDAAWTRLTCHHCWCLYGMIMTKHSPVDASPGVF